MMEFVQVISPFVLSLLIAAGITPAWIAVCRRWHLFDTPDQRKHHVNGTPSMGGISIFAALFITFFVFAGDAEFGKLKGVLTSAFILFITGFFDDLLNTRASRKLVMQIVAALLVAAGGIRIENYHGILGIYEIPVGLSWVTTVFVIVFFINAFNFIDGIDGLAATLGIIGSSVFSILFFKFGQADLALLSLSLAGACLGFLFYNRHPARVFMGDTGSLVIGLILISMGINLLQINVEPVRDTNGYMASFVFAVLFIPIYDLVRVSVIRMLIGNSPFSADRNHIHHMILQQGFGHGGATFILAFVNLFFIALHQFFKTLNPNLFVVLCICIAVISVNAIVMKQIARLRDRLFRAREKELNIRESKPF